MPKKQTKEDTKQKKPAFTREKIEPKDIRDFLSAGRRYSQFVTSEILDSAQAHGFLSMKPNLTAPSAFFYELDKKEEDNLKKELVCLPTRVKTDEMCLRPSILPLVIKFYLESKSRTTFPSIKLSYLGSIFEKSKDKGKFVDEKTEFGFEVLGEEGTNIEAELITMAYNLYASFGLKLALRINNLGCEECQPTYWQQLEDYYKNRKRYLCEGCKKLYGSKSLEFLSCTNANCQELAVDAPQLVDHLCEGCRDSFVSILEVLDEVEIPYVLDSKMILKPDYYGRIVFSIDLDGSKQKEVRTLVTGGRHDKFLVSAFGEKKVSATGFEGSVNEIVALMKHNNFSIPEKSEAEVFVAQLGEEAKKKALKLFEDLRKQDIKVAHAFDQDGLNQQISMASKLKARLILILGQREILDKTVLLRDTEVGAQEIISQDRIFDELKRRLSRSGINNHFVEPDVAKADEGGEGSEKDLKNIDLNLDEDL